MYRPIFLTVGTVAALAAGSMLAHGRDSASSRIDTASARAQAVRSDAGLRMDDALATAVIGSVSRQFATGDVTVQLADVHAVPTSIRDRELRGTGRVRIDGDAQWIDFSFAALYDTQTAEVTHPRLQLATASSTSAADASLVSSLDSRVQSALREEFSGQPVAWTQGATTVSGAAGRYVRVTGSGIADFGAEGRVDAQVEALYDRAGKRWLRVNYELGAAQDLGATQAVASI